jgi:hypothetical protein
MKERRFNRSVAYASSSLEADPNAATIVAAPFTSVPPPEFGGEGVVVFVDLDPENGLDGGSSAFRCDFTGGHCQSLPLLSDSGKQTKPICFPSKGRCGLCGKGLICCRVLVGGSDLGVLF